MTNRWQLAIAFAALVAVLHAALYIGVGMYIATSFDETELLTAIVAAALGLPITAYLYRERP